MRIESVKRDDDQQVFTIRTWRGAYDFPYGKASPAPSAANPVSKLYVDDELAREVSLWVPRNTNSRRVRFARRM